MKKIIFTLFVLALSATSSSAKERTEKEMQSIASKRLGLSISTMSTKAVNTTVKKVSESKQLAVYNSKGRGFVVIAKDDDFAPVLGYSDTDYDTDVMPCGLKWWMSQVEKSLEVRMAHAQTYQPAVYASSTAANFITTSWNQQAPYNTLCPKIDGVAAPTGCVATAMAQIMYYYQYPVSGKGKGSYTVTTSEGTTNYACDINSTYEWTKMKNKYLRPTGDTDNAVAKLMRDAGAASRMNYQAKVSGTIEWYAAKGFAENFRYDSLAISCLRRDFYTDAEWMEMVHKEMEAKQPVLYCGSDEIDGGHAFLLDGIQSDGKVHVNWGWSGSGNGWYDINILKPKAYDGSVLSSGNGFNIGQSMVCGFKKQETPSADEENISQWVTDGYSFYISNNELHVKLTNAYNYSHRVFEGRLDIVLQGMGDNSSKLYTDPIFETDTETPYVDMLSGFNYGDKDQPEVDFNLSQEPELKNISAGTYKLFLGSKSTKEKAYQCLRSVGGTIMYTLTVAADGTMTLAQDGTSAISAVAVKQNISAPYTYIYNMQGQEVYKSKTQDFCLDDVPAHGVLIVKQGDTTRKVVK